MLFRTPSIEMLIKDDDADTRRNKLRQARRLGCSECHEKGMKTDIGAKASIWKRLRELRWYHGSLDAYF
jgi:hypothetical protein